MDLGGALPNIFTKLKKHFNDSGVEVKIKKLEKNFRSTPEILKIANELINVDRKKDEFRKDLFTDNSEGSMPAISILKSTKDQSDYVIKKIEEFKRRGIELSKIMILGRNQSHYKSIKDAFIQSSIFYDDWKEIFSLLKREKIKDLIHWINVGHYGDNLIKWLKRVYNKPACGVGASRFTKLMMNGGEKILEELEKLSLDDIRISRLLAKIKELQAIANDENMNIQNKCINIAQTSGIINHHKNNENKLNSIHTFLNSPMVYTAKTWDEIYSNFEKYFDTENEDRLLFSTIHGVKGLEFDHVFVVSLSKGNMPSNRGLKICKTQKQIDEYTEEERRLLYVACTRAKQTLTFFTDKLEVSEFIDDMKKGLEIEYEDSESLWSRISRKFKKPKEKEEIREESEDGIDFTIDEI